MVTRLLYGTLASMGVLGRAGLRLGFGEVLVLVPITLASLPLKLAIQAARRIVPMAFPSVDLVLHQRDRTAVRNTKKLKR